MCIRDRLLHGGVGHLDAAQVLVHQLIVLAVVGARVDNIQRRDVYKRQGLGRCGGNARSAGGCRDFLDGAGTHQGQAAGQKAQRE